MKKLVAILLVVLAVPAIFLSCKKKPGDVIMLNYSIFFPPTHGQCKAGELWAKEIEDKTDGRVKINIYPGGTLVKAEDTFTGVEKGVSDIGMSCFAYTRGRFPIMEAVDLPLGYPDGKTATKVANEFYKAMKPKALDSVKVLLIHAHGPGLLHSVKPLKTLADLKGLKIRSTGLSSKIVKALGAIPVAMPQPETYEAVQKGVVDGTFGPIETLKGWKHAEVIKNTTDCPDIGYTTAMFVVMNRSSWEKLTPELQAVVTEVSHEWVDKHGAAWDQADAEGLAFVKELKKEIIPLPADEVQAWKDAVKPILDEYVAAAKAKDLPGDALLADIQAAIDAYGKNK